MMFLNEEHKEEWAAAIEKAGALTDYDTVKGDFAASLFIITGIPGLYRRAEKHVHDGWLDILAMVDGLGLSTGERILVGLAGNLYNGGFGDLCHPMDIIAYCDGEMVELATRAIRMRKQSVNINTIFE